MKFEISSIKIVKLLNTATSRHTKHLKIDGRGHGCDHLCRFLVNLIILARSNFFHLIPRTEVHVANVGENYVSGTVVMPKLRKFESGIPIPNYGSLNHEYD